MPLKFISVPSGLAAQHEWNLRIPKMITSGKTETLRDARKSEIESIDWTCDGQRLVVVHRNGAIKIYSTERMIEENSFAGSWTWAECHPTNPNIIAAVSWDGKVKLVDLIHGVKEHDLKKNLGEKFEKLLFCTWNSNNQIAIMTRADIVHVIDPSTGELVSTIQPGVDIYSVLFDLSGRLWVATGGTPGKIFVYDTNGVIVKELVAHSHSVMSLARVGEGIVSGGADALVCLWDTQNYACIRTFPDSLSPVTTLACGIDGTLVAWGSGGSKDGEPVLSIAGIQTGQHYASIPVHSAVTRVKWNPAGTALAYSMQDANVQIVTFPRENI